ncbi:hypothetical protein [Fortiea contorta]|uniref:hypothetical protein n=1 Tax=Fortiea contorta TaxID=1892405 RepID=UPI00034CEEED|nr:hypothetical protein [Fortiea contorta]
MNSEQYKIKFPLWHYLRQPLFGSRTKFIFNPRHFAAIWRIQLLERCWARECDAKGPQQH